MPAETLCSSPNTDIVHPEVWKELGCWWIFTPTMLEAANAQGRVQECVLPGAFSIQPDTSAFHHGHVFFADWRVKRSTQAKLSSRVFIRR
jgi:hypothetical protein